MTDQTVTNVPRKTLWSVQFRPVPISRTRVDWLGTAPVYVRNPKGRTNELLRVGDKPLTLSDQAQLVNAGHRFVYLRADDYAQFRKRLEEALPGIAVDNTLSLTDRCAVIYDTCIDLMSEVLAEDPSSETWHRVQRAAQALTTLSIIDAKTFRYLFTSARHDHDPATHAVNVAAWAVPLTYHLEHHDTEKLRSICAAALVHDVGERLIPSGVLEKNGPLTTDEWRVVHQHSGKGADALAVCPGIDPLAVTVARQHHEWMDGSGYPQGLAADRIDPAAGMISVLCTFDALTAVRPYRKDPMSVGDALQCIESESPDRFDPSVVGQWRQLVESVEGSLLPEPPHLIAGLEPVKEPDPQDSPSRRRFKRWRFHAPAGLCTLRLGNEGLVEHEKVDIIVHSMSRSGLAFLAPTQHDPGEWVRVYIDVRNRDSRYVEGEVVRSRRREDNWFETGVELLNLNEYISHPTAV